jgi:hypothetical protein
MYIRIEKVQLHSSLADPVALAAVSTVRNPFVAFQVTFPARQTASAHAARLGLACASFCDGFGCGGRHPPGLINLDDIHVASRADTCGFVKAESKFATGSSFVPYERNCHVQPEGRQALSCVCK